MKKFSIKFVLFVVLSLFSSLAYADGVFSRYDNSKFAFSILVPVSNYEQPTDSGSNIVNLDFVKNSKSIPSKDYFEASGSMSDDGITLKNKDINIVAYGNNFLSTEEINGLDKETIKEEFDNNSLNYNNFVKKYYKGKLPQKIDPLVYNYNKTLFSYGNKVSYKALGKNFYAVSYAENNKIHYEKVIYDKDNNFYVVFQASYPVKDKNFMNSIVTEMANSLKIIE